MNAQTEVPTCYGCGAERPTYFGGELLCRSCITLRARYEAAQADLEAALAPVVAAWRDRWQPTPLEARELLQAAAQATAYRADDCS